MKKVTETKVTYYLEAHEVDEALRTGFVDIKTPNSVSIENLRDGHVVVKTNMSKAEQKNVGE